MPGRNVLRSLLGSKGTRKPHPLRDITGMAFGSLILTLAAAPVMTPLTGAAATVSGPTRVAHPHTYKTEVQVGKQTTAAPQAFTLYKTTYMPIWYVMESLDKLGIKSQWDGRNWKMTTPKNVAVDFQSIRSGPGDAHIYLNGKLIWSVQSAVANDPSSGKPSTYMPIWYIMQTLHRVGIASHWGNSHWTLTVPTWSKTGSQTGSGSKGSGSGGTKSSGTGSGGTKSGSGTGSSGSSTGSGTGSQAGSGATSGGTGGSGSTPGSPPPVVVLPQPPLPANEVPRWSFDQQLLSALNMSPDSSGASPYNDISSSDPNWGYVHAAIEYGLVPADSAIHSGAYEAITLQMADTAYWNALGISAADATYQPGGNPVTWASNIGLNPAGLNPTDPLSPQDVAAFFSNLSNMSRGYTSTGDGSYQIVYPVMDEASATFAGDSANGVPFFSSGTAIQQAIDEVYQFYDGVTVQQQGSELLIRMPNLLGTNWFAYATTTNDIAYSLDGGVTWQSTSALDTRNLAGNAQAATANSILLRVPAQDGATLSISQLLPSFGGSVVLGELQVSAPNGQLLVNRINVAG